MQRFDKRWMEMVAVLMGNGDFVDFGPGIELDLTAVPSKTTGVHQDDLTVIFHQQTGVFEFGYLHKADYRRLEAECRVAEVGIVKIFAIVLGGQVRVDAIRDGFDFGG